MGVLQRFERRLEGLVEGTFALAFKSEVQPVEVASAVQREMDERAAIVAQGRTLVPNDFVVELSPADKERLDVYSDSLGQELSKLAREYASEQGYSFVGPVRVHFGTAEDLKTGRFRIRSGVIRGATIQEGELRRSAEAPQRGGGMHGTPRLIIESRGKEQEPYELGAQVTLLGRGTDCDLRLVDNGVSRHHAQIQMEEEEFVLVDLDSTNGSLVNGQRVQRARLSDGTQIRLGQTTLTFRRD